MLQVARNVTENVDEFLRAKRKLIVDRDLLYYCRAFEELLASAGVELVKFPPSSPNCNAIGERFVRSIKSECLDRFVFFGFDSLRRALAAFVTTFNSSFQSRSTAERFTGW